MICFIYILDARQNEYIAQFNDDTIMMSDYTIRVKNLPKDKKYEDREEILRAHLWLHFESLLMEKLGPAAGSSAVPKKCEIADITFGK